MAKVDYAFKAKILKEEEELLHRYKRAKWQAYLQGLYINEGIVSKALIKGFNDSIHDIEFDCFLNNKIDVLNEIDKIDNASNQRTKRLKKRIASMLLKGNCIFLTITFKDSVLDSTSEQTRKDYVRRFLKSLQCDYIANIDYGSKNEREHYHAIVQKDRVCYKDWSYGNLDFERVRVNGKDYEKSKSKLSKYVCKLCNHAIKESTKRCCVMYSR